MNYIRMYLRLVNNSFFRFLAVGLVNTLVGLSLMFVLLHGIGLSYWVSTFTGNAVGAGVSFLLNKSFTFKSNVPLQTGLPRFCVIIMICYISSFYCSERIMEVVGDARAFGIVDVQTGAVLLGSAIYTISNYLGQKYLVFRKISTV
ncbi:GtrA family protein [Bacillus rubiinfantis]|uniref:GtrA family protein n=1 Tax=Bacillus rubiinfantis TaxID=1499680 RepID=UPI0005A66D8C|nr:GtrA family protein [Bacillus rubiinfantis]